MRQVAEVCVAGISSQIDNPQLQSLPYSELPASVYEALSHGRYVGQTSSEFEPNFERLLAPQGIKSLLLLPIQIGGEWGGFIGFDDCTQERRWRQEDIQLLGAASAIVGAYLSRQRSDETLRRTKQLYRQTLDATVDMVLVKDRESRIVWANKAFREYYGLSLEQIRNGVDTPISKPTLSQQYLDDDRRVFESSQSLDIPQEPIARHDGTQRLFHTVKSPIVDDRSRVTHLVAVCRDITDRTAADRQMQKVNAQLRLLQVVATAANLARDVDEALLVGLNEVCTHTGWPVGHVYTRDENDPAVLKPTELWHLGDAPMFEAFRQVTETTIFRTGEGLPGRVFAERQPAWIEDVMADDNFPRAKLAEDIGVRGAFAFPVLVGQTVVAVLEFFSHNASQNR